MTTVGRKKVEKRSPNDQLAVPTTGMRRC